MSPKTKKNSQDARDSVFNVNVGGDVSGNIIIGNNNVVTKKTDVFENDVTNNVQNTFEEKQNLQTLIGILSQRLNSKEVSYLSFESGVDYDNFNSGTKVEMITKMIDALQQRGQLSKFLAELQKMRPDVFDALSMFKDPLSKYKVGERLTGTIKKIIPAGLIIELKSGGSGLVHISQVGSNFVSLEELNRQFRIGEEVKVVILNIDMENHKLSLSIKQV